MPDEGPQSEPLKAAPTPEELPGLDLGALVAAPRERHCVHPTPGEVITSMLTGNTYTIGSRIGVGNFGVVFSCKDIWENDLAAKVLKPLGTYEKIKASAEAEFAKLVFLRHPNITYIYDAFEFRDTFYIITERCLGPVSDLFSLKDFNGLAWLIPIARCLLQAVHYLHINKVVHQDIHAGNVFTTFVRDEMPTEAKAIQFKLADLGVAKLFSEVDAENTRAQWMRPPEVLRPAEFGPLDYRIDVYHLGLLFLQLAYSQQLSFSEEDILAGKPRTMAQQIPSPTGFALEKALRRHVPYRTSNAMELWRDLHVPGPIQSTLVPSQEPTP